MSKGIAARPNPIIADHRAASAPISQVGGIDPLRTRGRRRVPDRTRVPKAPTTLPTRWGAFPFGAEASCGAVGGSVGAVTSPESQPESADPVTATRLPGLG